MVQCCVAELSAINLYFGHAGIIPAENLPMTRSGLKSLRQRFHALAMLVMGTLGVLLPPLPAAAEGPAAGTVKATSGKVTAERDGVRRELKPGDPIYPGERIRTAVGAQAAITLRDDTRIAAGQKTAIEVKTFEYDTTSQDGNLVVSVLRGVTAFVSGSLAKAGVDRMKVVAPNATAGVRGTEFVVEVDPGWWSDDE